MSQLTAKLYFGLGYLPVYIASAKYEYIYAPHQDLFRFGNHIQTNSLGMRSPEPSSKNGVRILKIGDSVINGGAHVDQDNLSSSILTKDLSKYFSQPITVFNLSAQSWGPDNAYAFIQEHGDLNAQIIVLVFSSHDLHDNMHFKPVVGHHAAWPAKQPLCALTDAIGRYAWPKIKSLFGARSQEYDYLYDFDDSKLNPGWHQLFQYPKSKSIPVILYVHATTDELKQKSYDKYGLEIIRMAKENNVELIKGIDQITDLNCYRDKIHLNQKGHQKLAGILNPVLKKHLNNILK